MCSSDLARCVQKPEETATQFLVRWIQTKASYENVDDNQAIHAFTRDLLKGSSLRHRLVQEQVKDLGSMLEIASMYAQADDDTRDGEGATDLAIARRTGAKRKALQDAGTSNKVAATFCSVPALKNWQGTCVFCTMVVMAKQSWDPYKKNIEKE